MTNGIEAYWWSSGIIDVTCAKGTIKPSNSLWQALFVPTKLCCSHVAFFDVKEALSLAKVSVSTNLIIIESHFSTLLRDDDVPWMYEIKMT